MDSMWKILQKEIDIEDPTPLIDHVYLGCTQREAKVDLHAVQSQTGLFKKLTTTRKADQKVQAKENIRWKRSLLGAMICKVMPKNAWRDTANEQRRSPAGCNTVRRRSRDTTGRLSGELSAVCTQIFLQCLYVARIGRPELLWSVNTLARSVTNWIKTCDKKIPSTTTTPFSYLELPLARK